jgi:hypothetical protein
MRMFASTAMPIVRTTPAMPGSVRVAPKKAMMAIRNTRFRIIAMTEMNPEVR